MAICGEPCEAAVSLADIYSDTIPARSEVAILPAQKVSVMARTKFPHRSFLFFVLPRGSQVDPEERIQVQYQEL